MSYPQQPQQPPQFQPQPQFQQQPQQPQPPMGMLNLTIQGSVMTSSFIPPTVHLNGYPVRVKYGRNDIPVFAGPLHIDVHCQWMRTFGRAALDCTIQPNQAVPVFYASPMHQFANEGSIGHTKMKRKGKGVFIGLMVVIAVGVVLSFVGALLG